MNRLSVIGSGFSGLSAACFLAGQGQQVTVFEKNKTTGGRARAFAEEGFTFDMGPSWYWMPDIFENFFASFQKSPADYYKLIRLDPGFQIIFGKQDVLQIPAELPAIYELFEQTEKGSADKLKKFLAEGRYKYEAGMQQMVYKPSFSWSEFAKWEVLRGAAKLHMFKSVSAYVRSYFKDQRLRALMEFPVLFLGATSERIPALYSLMNYAALSLGTWYPMGGMTEIISAMENLAHSMDVDIIRSCEVNKIMVKGNESVRLATSKGNFSTDGIIATGDYHHIEQCLLDKPLRNYSEAYWKSRTMAPSCLIFYLGVNKKIKRLIHHNLFFDESLDDHAKEIYDAPKWPAKPLFYACCPSKTDDTVAPEGMDNLFVLIPIAPGLEDTAEVRGHYFRVVMERMEKLCSDSIIPHVIYNKSYCINDFVNDYHAYRGNAYGLANTLRQTAVLKPCMRNKKVKNLFYAGQLTVPGPGVPPAIISGEIAAKQLLKQLK